MKRYSQGADYLDGFILRVAKKLFVPFSLCLGCWCVYLYTIGALDVVVLYRNFILRGSPPLPNSWYVFELFGFYIFFWVSYRMFCGAVVSLLSCSSLVLLVFCGLIFLPGWKVHWWLSSLAFPIGLVVASHEEFVVRYRKWIAVGIAGALAALYVVGLGFDIHSPGYNLLRVWWHCCVGLSSAIILYRFGMESSILSFLGGLSFELYLVHGCFVQVFSSLSTRPILYVPCVLVASFVAALALRKVLFHVR